MLKLWTKSDLETKKLRNKITIKIQTAITNKYIIIIGKQVYWWNIGIPVDSRKMRCFFIKGTEARSQPTLSGPVLVTSRRVTPRHGWNSTLLGYPPFTFYMIIKKLDNLYSALMRKIPQGLNKIFHNIFHHFTRSYNYTVEQLILSINKLFKKIEIIIITKFKILNFP